MGRRKRRPSVSRTGARTPDLTRPWAPVASVARRRGPFPLSPSATHPGANPRARARTRRLPPMKDVERCHRLPPSTSGGQEDGRRCAWRWVNSREDMGPETGRRAIFDDVRGWGKHVGCTETPPQSRRHEEIRLHSIHESRRCPHGGLSSREKPSARPLRSTFRLWRRPSGRRYILRHKWFYHVFGDSVRAAARFHQKTICNLGAVNA